MSERLTAEQEALLRAMMTECDCDLCAPKRALWEEIDILRRERDDAKEVAASVWGALFGDQVPADWQVEIEAMKAAASLQRSDELPTEAGLYWLWEHRGSRELPAVIVEVFSVAFTDEPRLFAQWIKGRREALDHVGGQWAGPLQPPGGES